jgi:Xaa-Pro aminopeptidase
MRSDIDQLMQARGLEAIVVTGGEYENPLRRYLANGVDTHGGWALKRRGADPVLLVSAMERDEAARSGLHVYTYDDFNWLELVKQAEGEQGQAVGALWGRLLERLGVTSGKVGVYGVGNLHNIIEQVRDLSQQYPQYEFVGESGRTLFDEAFVTKDEAELRVIREVADKTNAVMAATWDFISSHRADGDTVVNASGQPLTIGAVKRFVRRELMERDLEDTAMIFAQGRDAGVPHSRGNDAEALRVGQSIVFDLFPRQMGGGYHHDMTRTWCIGHAPPAVQALYDTVMTAFQVALDTYAEPGQPTHTMQDAVLDYFEAQDHPTPRSKPGTTSGYVHSLGHGVGLNIHERPSISHLVKKDIFEKGNFITIEPGLYYPEQGMGVRIEDALIIDDSGALVSITPFHKELVLPLKG